MIKYAELTKENPVLTAPSSIVEVSVADRSQFPLFMQTTAALFGFLLLIFCFSWISTLTTNSQTPSAQTLVVPQNIN